jgi:hypothetical protein
MNQQHDTSSKNNRKKPAKIIIITLVVFLLVIGGIVAVVLNVGKSSEEARFYADKIQEESRQSEELARVELDQAIVLAKKEIAVLSDTSVNAETGQLNIEVSSDDKGPLSLTAEEKAALTQVVKDKYHTILLNQKDLALGQVQGLIGQAKTEYQSLKGQGTWNASTKVSFISKYMAKVDVLETQMDKDFKGLLSDMEARLVAEGLEATPIIESFQAEYKTIKEANRKAFMDKAKEALKK